MQLVGYLNEAGEQKQRYERRRLPDLRKADHDQRCSAVAEPVGAQPEPGVDEARIAGKCVLPGVRRDDRHDRVRDEHSRPHETPSEDRLLHDEREGETDHELGRHRDDSNQERRRKVRPPEAVGEDHPVVLKPHEVALIRRRQPVVEERQVRGVGDRIGGHGEQDDDCRRREEKAKTPLGLRLLAELTRAPDRREAMRTGSCRHQTSRLPRRTARTNLLAAAGVCEFTLAGGWNDRWRAAERSP